MRKWPRRETEAVTVPGNYRIHGDAPLVFGIVKIGMAYPTVQNLYRHVVWTILSAETSSGYRRPFPSDRRKKKKKKQNKNRDKKRRWLCVTHLRLKVYGVILPEESWAAQPETVCVWFGVVCAIDSEPER